MSTVLDRHTEEYKEWISNLKPGDEVAIKSYLFGSGRWAIDVVDKVTPTGRINTKSSKFHNTGEEIGKGSSWDIPSSIYPVTKEIEDDVLRIKILRMVKNTDFEKLSNDQLINIAHIIKGI